VLPSRATIQHLFCAQRFSDYIGDASADESRGCGPMMQAKYHSGDDGRNSGDLHDRADVFEMGICRHSCLSFLRAPTMRLW
jgi:hypothetical protein